MEKLSVAFLLLASLPPAVSDDSAASAAAGAAAGAVDSPSDETDVVLLRGKLDVVFEATQRRKMNPGFLEHKLLQLERGVEIVTSKMILRWNRGKPLDCSQAVGAVVLALDQPVSGDIHDTVLRIIQSTPALQSLQRLLQQGRVYLLHAPLNASLRRTMRVLRVARQELLELRPLVRELQEVRPLVGELHRRDEEQRRRDEELYRRLEDLHRRLEEQREEQRRRDEELLELRRRDEELHRRLEEQRARSSADAMRSNACSSWSCARCCKLRIGNAA